MHLKEGYIDLKLGQLWNCLTKGAIYSTQQHNNFIPSPCIWNFPFFTSTKSAYKFFSVFVCASYTFSLQFYNMDKNAMLHS